MYSTSNSLVDISVIICTHNRAFLLPDVLNSLEKTEIPENTEIELVIVDNACSDNTFQTIEEYAKNSKFKIKPLKEPRKGKTFALNTAINKAAGELLAFVDDDHIVSPGYFKAIRSALANYPDFNLFCGRITPNWDGTEPHGFMMTPGTRYDRFRFRILIWETEFLRFSLTKGCSFPAPGTWS